MVPDSRGCSGRTFPPPPRPDFSCSPVCTGRGTGRTRAGGPCGIVPRSRDAQVREGEDGGMKGARGLKALGAGGMQSGVWVQKGCDTNLCMGWLDPPPRVLLGIPHPLQPCPSPHWGFQVTRDPPPNPFGCPHEWHLVLGALLWQGVQLKKITVYL